MEVCESSKMRVKADEHVLLCQDDTICMLCKEPIMALNICNHWQRLCSFCFVSNVMFLFCSFKKFSSQFLAGVVGCGEGVVYLTSPGRQTDIGLQWARPAILVASKDRGGMFVFLLFFNFIPTPLSYCPSLSSPLLSLLSHFSLSLDDDTKWPTRVDVSLNTTQSIGQFLAKECSNILIYLLKDYAWPGKVSLCKLNGSSWPLWVD